MKPTDIITAIRDLATLQAGTIQRMGAAYGSPEDWRRDFTEAVKIMEAASRALACGNGGER